MDTFQCSFHTINHNILESLPSPSLPSPLIFSLSLFTFYTHHLLVIFSYPSTWLRFNLCVQQIPWRRKWQPTPVFLPGKFHEQRSLVGYSPWGHKESDTTEWLLFLFFLSTCLSLIFFPISVLLLTTDYWRLISSAWSTSFIFPKRWYLLFVLL